MRASVRALIVAVAAFVAAVPAVAQDPLEDILKGLRDLQGKGPVRARLPTGDVAARFNECMRLATSGRLLEALDLCQAVRAEVERRDGRRDTLDHAGVLSVIASVQQDLGQYEAALATYREGIAITSRAPDGKAYHARDLLNLSTLLMKAGRLAEAEAGMRRAIAILEREGSQPDLLDGVELSLGEVLRLQGRPNDGEQVLRAALERIKRRQQRLDLLAGGINNLALIQIADGRTAAAEGNLSAVLARLKGSAAERSTIALLVMSTRAIALSQLGRHEEAERQAREMLASGETWFPGVAEWKSKLAAGLGVIQANAGRCEEAIPFLSDAIDSLVTLEQRVEGLVAPAVDEDLFRRLYVAALAHCNGSISSDPVRDQVFVAAQSLGPSATGRAVRQMALAAGASDAETAAMTRALKDAEQELVKFRLAAFKGGANTARALQSSIARATARREEALARLEQRHPGSRRLTTFEPLAFARARQSLAADEALVWVFPMPQPTRLFGDLFVWVVTRESERLVPIADREIVSQDVAALRCGLDIAIWGDWSVKPGDATDTAAMKARRRREQEECRTLLAKPAGWQPRPAGKALRGSDLPFDPDRAYRVYRAVLGPVADLIAGKKRLLFVPGGPFQKLPPHLLLSKPRVPGNWADQPWLLRDHVVTILPAVSSLEALRDAGPSRAGGTLLTFANPLLDGTTQEDATLAAIAKKHDRCADTPSLAPKLDPVPAASIPAGLSPSLDQLRRLAPLPETADESCLVAASLKADRRRIYLAAGASAPVLKALDRDGELAHHRILHFATHGLLPREIAGGIEPGFVLTPPERQTLLDDGYLSGSEIGALKLDADLVILSACNTAGPDGSDGGAEALSGLARAFFLAGARSVLASHWTVDSEAAVRLVTTMMDTSVQGAGSDRATALAGAMQAMLKSADARHHHPALWAPFVLVGQGGGIRAGASPGDGK